MITVSIVFDEVYLPMTIGESVNWIIVDVSLPIVTYTHVN